MPHPDDERHPINLQDPVGKVVGRRRTIANPLNTATHSKKLVRGWRKAFPTPAMPKGVFCFRTFEEADEWLWKAITRLPKS